MGYLSQLFNNLTNNKALEQANGKLESYFFGKVYRAWYITGLSSEDHSVVYFMYKSTIKAMIGLVIFTEMWFAVTEASSLDVIAGSINIILIQLIALYRYWNMLHNKDIYRKLATSMESPNFDISTESRRQLLHYWAKLNDRYLKLVLILGNCTLACWFLYPLLDELEYNMFIAVRIPFNYQSPMRYAISYTVFMISFTCVGHFVMVNDLMMQAHLLNLVCQFSVLGDCLENALKECELRFPGEQIDRLLHNEDFQKAYRKRMGDLVQQHRSILSYVLDLRRTLSSPMLGQLLASGILIAFLGYQTATTLTENLTQGLMSLLFLFYNMFEFFIICRWCEEITVQCQKIGDSVYFSQWEYGVATCPGVKSSLMLIMARASKPVIFSAGGMYNLSLESYASLVKTSYSAFTVLLRFR